MVELEELLQKIKIVLEDCNIGCTIPATRANIFLVNPEHRLV